MLGVLALAHDRPIDPAMRPLVQASADLAAVAIERWHTGARATVVTESNAADAS